MKGSPHSQKGLKKQAAGARMGSTVSASKSTHAVSPSIATRPWLTYQSKSKRARKREGFASLFSGRERERCRASF